MFTNPTAPNLTDYTLFVQNVMGIAPGYLPADSPFLGYALQRAMDLVINVPAGNAAIEYVLAVYNCAGHIQLMITPDQIVNGVSQKFFVKQRDDQDLLKRSDGVVSASSDESTSTTLATPDALRQLTIQDLGFMKTVWGREYLSFNQDFGGIWGLS